jgi:PAS domain S-box-containing protein
MIFWSLMCEGQKREATLNHAESAATEASVLVADELERSKDRILARWEGLVRRELCAAREISRPTLMDSLPEFIDQLAQSLRTQSSGAAHSTLIKIASEHAEDRAVHTHYTIEQVIREYELLRKIIFDALERKGLLGPPEREKILEAVTTGMAKASSEFAAIAAGREEKMQEEVIKKEKLFRSIFELANAGKAVVDLKTFRYLEVNRKLCQMLGYNKQELISKSAEDITHPDDREWQLKLYQEARDRDDASWAVEKRYIAKDGRIVWGLVSGARLSAPEGESGRAIVTIVDVTARKQIEAEKACLLEEEKRNVEQLKEERALRDKFVATLSHDLRTPLVAAKMCAQLISARILDPEKMKGLATRIAQSIDRADGMIRDLLDASRLHAGFTIRPKIEPVELVSVVSAALEELRALYGDRFRFSAPDRIEAHLCSAGMRRIVENLCSNAIKYGCPKNPVTVALTACDDEITLSVYNVGEPLTKADRNRLFQLFQRASEVESSKRPGWGIGLTIVKGIAECLGGRVVVKAVDHGTEFQITVPRDARKAAAEADHAPVEAHAGLGAAP